MSWWHQALDRSVVFSFDRTGFARHAQGFDRHDDAQRLDGQRYLVTGCNSGIGFAAVEQLAARGAQVLLACRSSSVGAQRWLRSKSVLQQPTSRCTKSTWQTLRAWPS